MKKIGALWMLLSTLGMLVGMVTFYFIDKDIGGNIIVGTAIQLAVVVSFGLIYMLTQEILKP